MTKKTIILTSIQFLADRCLWAHMLLYAGWEANFEIPPLISLHVAPPPPKKSTPYDLLLIARQWFELIKVILCTSVERLY